MLFSNKKLLVVCISCISVFAIGIGQIAAEELYAEDALAAVQLAKDDSSAALDRLLQLNPPDTYGFQHWFNVGVLQYDTGRYTDAVRSFEKARSHTDTEEQLADAYFNSGISLLRAGEYETAVVLFTESIDLGITPSSLVNRGNALYASGDLESALSDYQRAIQMNPSYAEAHYNTGNIYYDRGELAEAYTAYSTAVRNQSTFFEAYYNRGNISLLLGNYEAARDDFRRALEISPEDNDAAAHLEMAEDIILQQREAEGDSD